MSTQEVIELNQKAIESIERFTKRYLKNSNNQDEASTIEELASSVREFSDSIEEMKKQQKIFDEYKSRINSVGDNISFKKILKAYNIDGFSDDEEEPEKSNSRKVSNDKISKIEKAFEKLDREKIADDFEKEVDETKEKILNKKSCEMYDNFMKLVSKSISRREEKDEIEAVSESVNAIDPISKLPMVDPVKNKICGHVYDNISITQLLSKNPKTKCPIPGCVASDYVKKSDLVPDHEMKRLILSQTSSDKNKKDNDK